MKKAEKLSATNEEEAYLFGILLRKAVSVGKLHKTVEERVHDAVKGSIQQIYYEQQEKPQFEDWSALTFFLSIFGFIGIVCGIYMLIENSYVISFHSTYLVQIIRGGGYAVIFGLVLLLGGIAKGRQEMVRKKLLRQS